MSTTVWAYDITVSPTTLTKAQAEAEMKRAARRAALDARSDGPQA